ncbi:hypothetical protein BDN71DRAFT_1572984 [Pleurotus eryngii]|uniref:Uncharacterized protein n=1 Tax=Pleurotus eryngii TaxID=5323 RepID=A0A9P6D4Y3_PLEER|nr:hypothetical protein BDN71DRAFT_1572984 [Pleurotus eryngii]
MDTFYNKSKAVQTLDKIIVEQTAAAASPQMYILDSIYNRIHTSSYQESTETFGLSICQRDGDAVSRLTQCNEETGETEEATIAIQGIMSSINFLPFNVRSHRSDNVKCLAHARQSMTLMELGSPYFDQMVENSRHTCSMFSRYTLNAKLLLRPEFLAKYSAETDGGINQHVMITASNRFFTPIKQARALEAVDINVKIDPRGLLAKVDQTRYVHTKDNTIDYYALTEVTTLTDWGHHRDPDVDDMHSTEGKLHSKVITEKHYSFRQQLNYDSVGRNVPRATPRTANRMVAERAASSKASRDREEADDKPAQSTSSTGRYVQGRIAQCTEGRMRDDLVVVPGKRTEVGMHSEESSGHIPWVDNVNAPAQSAIDKMAPYIPFQDP